MKKQPKTFTEGYMIGYARVSTADQNLDLQILELAERAAQAAVAAERERCAGIALSFRGANHTDETCQAIADKIRG